MLVQRIQEINSRLAADTEKLSKEQEREEENIKKQKSDLNAVRNDQQTKRLRAKGAKSKLIDDK